jgi:hypothetical protein
MPQNCSADVQVAIAHIDEVFSGNDTNSIQEIKELFGLGDMTHLDDVAGACMFDCSSNDLVLSTFQ